MTAHKWQFASRFRRQAFGWRSDLPDVDARTRQRWLDRLWQAINDDDMPYIETLAERWGELCGTRELASAWAEIGRAHV